MYEFVACTVHSFASWQDIGLARRFHGLPARNYLHYLATRSSFAEESGIRQNSLSIPIPFPMLYCLSTTFVHATVVFCSVTGSLVPANCHGRTDNRDQLSNTLQAKS